MSQATLLRSAPSMWKNPGKWPLHLFNLAMMVLTAVPIVHMTQLLLTTGANSFGNDFVVITPVIGRILDGRYNWLNFFQDTFIYGVHSDAAPIALFALLAEVVDFNDYVSIIFGLLTNVLIIALLYKTMSHRIQHWTKITILPIGAFLFFSNSQTSTLSFSFVSLQMALSILGFVLGSWATVCFPKSWRSIALIVLGGCMAAWSAAYGVAAWPVLLVCMLAQGYRDIRHYAVFLFGGLVAALPYLSFMQLGASPVPLSLTRFQLVTQIIALPLEQYDYFRTGYSIVGVFGLAVLVSGIVLAVVLQPRKHAKTTIPPLLVVLFSIVGVYIASLSRDIAAVWYTPSACVYWMGLAAFVIAILNIRGTSGAKVYQSLWAIAVALAFTMSYIFANNNYLDKAMVMAVRSPASASCVRYFRTAPTFCEQMVFNWASGRPLSLTILAEPLERHGLTNFASRQIWTLQGDFGLDNVVLHEHPNIPAINWMIKNSGTQATVTSWNDFRHADLLVHAPNAVDWTLAIPLNANEVTFSSAVAISESVAQQAPFPDADGVLFAVRIRSEDGALTTVYQQHVSANDFVWYPFTIPLLDYAGQTITITLAADPVANVAYDWGLYRFPRVDILIDPNRGSTAPQLDLRNLIPEPSRADAVLQRTLWQVENVDNEVNGRWHILGEEAAVYQPLQACFGDYSHLAIRLSATNSLGLNNVIVKLFDELTAETLAHEGGIVRQFKGGALPSMVIPIHTDGESRTYTYPLRLLGLPNDFSVRGIGLQLQMRDGASITVEDARLLRDNNEQSMCN